MNCPSCNKPPISLGKFVFALDSTSITCDSCGAKLLMGPLWRRASKAYFWGGIAYGLLLALNGAAYLLSDAFPIPILHLLLFGLIVEALILTVFWTQARYMGEKKEDSRQKVEGSRQ